MQADVTPEAVWRVTNDNSKCNRTALPTSYSADKVLYKHDMRSCSVWTYLGNIAKDYLGSEANEQLHSALHIHLLTQPLRLNHCTLIFASGCLVHTCTAADAG